MLFEDLFYTGNPARRQQVSDLKAEIKGYVTKYRNQWNRLVNLLNKAFTDIKDEKYHGIHFKVLTRDVEIDITAFGKGNTLYTPSLG